MRKSTRTTCLVVGVFLSVFVLPAFSSENPCLRYEPATVELTGTIKRVTFPGPPNWQSVQEGDKPERYWILYLTQPICVYGADRNGVNVDEKDVKEVQLILHSYDKYRELIDKQVIIRGSLTHAITGHHHTNVLITVKDITKPRQ